MFWGCQARFTRLGRSDGCDPACISWYFWVTGLKKPPLQSFLEEPDAWIGVLPNVFPRSYTAVKGPLSLLLHSVLSGLLTSTPALLTLVDGPWRSDPVFFFLPGVTFAKCVGILARIYHLLDFASTAVPWTCSHPPSYLLRFRNSFSWDAEQEGWIRPGSPPLRMMAGPVRHFRGAVFPAWQDTVAADLC